MNLDELARRPERACRDIPTAVFYPDNRAGFRPALNICAQCPIRIDCLDAALQTPVAEDYGIWGGTTDKERKRLRNGQPGRRRRIVAVCGTLGGYTAHKRLGEPPCRSCRDAQNVYQRERYAAKKGTA